MSIEKIKGTGARWNKAVTCPICGKFRDVAHIKAAHDLESVERSRENGKKQRGPSLESRVDLDS